MIHGLDLFSGIGGLALALKEWVRPIAYCERDRYCQSILLSKMFLDGSLPEAPIWDDVRTLTEESLPSVDIIYGGFPCQDISSAGAGRGLAGERSGLYFEVERLVRETKPPFVFLENVPAIRTRGLGRVVWGLSELGYDCRWTVVSAEEVGAPHLRKRWFLLATAKDATPLQRSPLERNESNGNHEWPEALADTNSDTVRIESGRRGGKSWGEEAQPVTNSWWSIEPELGRVAHGVPQRVDRLRGLGNAVVPHQAKVAFMRLIGLESA